MTSLSEPAIRYDEPSDALHIAFVPGRSATGVELDENLLLRLDREAETPIGLTIFNFSVLAQQTGAGPRSFPLTGLADLDENLRSLALRVLLHPALTEYLSLSADSPDQNIPTAFLHADRMIQHA